MSGVGAILRRALLGLVLALIVAYSADYLALRFQIPNHRDQFATVPVQLLYAVPQKNGKTEFILGDVQPQRCSQSVFPQLGLPPCWYLNRHKQRQLDM